MFVELNALLIHNSDTELENSYYEIKPMYVNVNKITSFWEVISVFKNEKNPLDPEEVVNLSDFPEIPYLNTNVTIELHSGELFTVFMEYKEWLKLFDGFILTAQNQ